MPTTAINSGPATLKARVTQTDVARVAGVHNTTVSLALRNCGAIPESTRKRIRAIADELGYYRDPTLQALVAYRNRHLSQRTRETLAYITNADTRWGWQQSPSHERTHLGAQRRAAELGYQLEHFWLGEPGMSPPRLGDILYHRGITGVVLADHPVECRPRADLDWSRLCAVQIGSFPRAPALHRVADDCGGMVRRALRRVLDLGYERVGLALAEGCDEAVDQAWSSGYLAERHRLPVHQQVPVLRLPGSRPAGSATRPLPVSAAATSVFGQWFRAYRPEVILGFSPMMPALAGRLGLSVPQEVAYVDLCLENADGTVAGMRPNSDTTGEVAVALLVANMQQNHRGLPPVPTATMVDGAWLGGASLPSAPASPRREELLPAPDGEIPSVWLAPA